MAFKRQGQSWLELAKNKEALTAFNNSLAYQPEDIAAQQGKAISLYRLGNYERAIKIIEQILDSPELTSEQQAINWLYKGVSLCQTSQSSVATKAFAKVIKLSKNPPDRKIAKAGCGIN